MIIHKYLLPASLAATVHVALLWLLPEQHFTRIIEMPITIPKPPIPKAPDNVVTAPEEKEETTEPVAKMAGGPSRPEIPEPMIPPKPDDISIPKADSTINPWKDLVRLSPHTGPGGPGDVGPGDWTRKPFIAVSELDGVPRAKVQLPPDYPAAMRQTGVGGSVLVEFDVNAEGRVVRAEAIRYTCREFAEPAVRAVKKWRFEPGRRNGKTVPFRMTVPIEFGIESN